MERTETLTSATAPDRDLPGSYVDLPAVFGGAVVAAATAGLFTAFGAGLGFSTISAEPGEGSFNAWIIVTGIWIVITLVASYMAGGYVAGRMRRRVDSAGADEVAARDGINGLVVWGLGMLVTAWMAAGAIQGVASAVAGAAGTAVEAAGSVVGGTASAIGQATGAVDGDAMAYIVDTLMRPTPDSLAAPATPVVPGEAAAPAVDDADLAAQGSMILGNVLRTGEISEDERAYLVAAVAARTGLPAAEVEARVDTAVTAAQDLRTEAARLADEAEETAIAAAETARIGAILTGFILTAASLVAAAAAIAGAVRGGRHRDEGRLFGGFSYRLK